MRPRFVLALSLLALALLLPATSRAQGFQSVFSKDGIDVWAVGDGGMIYRSFDGGATWTNTTLGARTLRGVAARGLQSVAVSDSGKIWSSTNNGGAWALTVVPGAPNLRGVSMPSAQIAYVVGAGGTILKSIDGGATWNSEFSGTASTLSAVRFINDLEGWAVGNAGTVLRTTDGGENWFPIGVNTTANLNSIDVKGTTVWVVGDAAVARRSTDDGATWEAVNLRADTRPDVRAVWLKTPTTVFIAGGGGFIRRSLDSGRTWVFPKHQMQKPISSMVFAGTRAWACSDSNFAVLGSSDQDTTWAFPAGTTVTRTWTQQLPFAGSVRGSTICINPFDRNIFYCALGPSIYRSPDAGYTWRLMSTVTGVAAGTPINAMIVSPRDSSRMTVAVNSASSTKRLMMTTTAGLGPTPPIWFTTLTHDFGNYGIPLEQDPDRPDTIYFSGDNDKLYRSTNGGFNYFPLSSNNFRSPCDIISVPDSGNVILVGDGVTSVDHAVFWKSSDWGQTFSVIDTCDVASEIPGMSIGRLRNNVAFGTNWGAGGVWRTKDYGSSWQSVSLVGSSWGTDVSKDDPNCMIFGTYGGSTVYLSLDGGDSFINTTLSAAGVANYSFYVRDRGTLLAEQSNGIWRMQFAYSYVPHNTQSVGVVSPNGGESWEAGSVHNLTWSSQNLALARIEYRRTAADSWQFVADVPGYLNTYAWTVPEDATLDAKIRVRDAWDATPFDETNGTFTINLVPRLTVNPDPYEFSTTLTGNTASGVLYLENPGSATLNVSAVTSNSPAFWPGRTSLVIPAHGNDTLGVFYSPANPGSDAAQITVVANDPGSSHVVQVTGTGASTLAAGDDAHPVAFALWQNRPNPFERATSIRYALPVAAPVSLDVFNLLGQRVATLVRETQGPGVYTVPFGPGAKTTNHKGIGALPAGVYFYRFQAGTFASTRKMLLLD